MASEEQRMVGRQSDAAEMNLGYCTAHLIVAVGRGIADIAAPYELTALEFTLLETCLQRGECNATLLVELLPTTDPSRISRMVAKLVDMGLLRRRRPAEDRRVVMLTLTDAGNELASLLVQRVEQYYAMLTEGVSAEDMDVFVATVARIMENYVALGEAESGYRI